MLRVPGLRILITGGTGFIGSALCPALLADGHQLTLLTRHPPRAFAAFGNRVQIVRRFDDLPASTVFEAVINLAGEGISNRPWTSQRKQELYASRVTLTEELVNWIRRAETRPGVLLSSSAISWYGNQQDRLLEEDASGGSDYLHGLCRDWEAAAQPVERMKVRLCLLRTGLVLGRSGGVMKKLLPLFSLGLGGRLGSGQQWVSWIALADYIEVVRFLLQRNDMKGIFNVTAPRPVTNGEFASILARVLRRPALLHIPAGVLRTAMGEMSDFVLASQRALPSRLLGARFSFRYRTLEEALRGVQEQEQTQAA